MASNLSPSGYAILGGVTAAAQFGSVMVTDKIRDLKRTEGREAKEMEARSHASYLKVKMAELQASVAKKYPYGMSDAEAQEFYLSRASEFKSLSSVYLACKAEADAGDAACMEVVKIAQERGRHWKITLWLDKTCSLL